MESISVIALVLSSVSITLVFMSRTWLKAEIEQSIKHDYEQKIEAIRSELRKNEEEVKSDLRSRETEIAALRDGPLTGRAQRQAMLDQRMLKAVEGVWAGIVELAPYKGISGAMATFKIEAVAKESPKNPQLRQIFAVITGMHKIEPDKFVNKPKHEQPFVSSLAWAYLSAYQAAVLSSFTLAKTLELGIENPQKMLKTEDIKAMVKAVLPHQEQFIAQYDVTSLYYLLDEIEQSLLTELQRTLRGEEQDAADVERAANIITLAAKITTANTQSIASATSATAPAS